jgi:hypothetical protein
VHSALKMSLARHVLVHKQQLCAQALAMASLLTLIAAASLDGSCQVSGASSGRSNVLLPLLATGGVGQAWAQPRLGVKTGRWTPGRTTFSMATCSNPQAKLVFNLDVRNLARTC